MYHNEAYDLKPGRQSSKQKMVWSCSCFPFPLFPLSAFSSCPIFELDSIMNLSSSRVGEGALAIATSPCPDPDQGGCSLQNLQKTAGMFQEEGGSLAP